MQEQGIELFQVYRVRPHYILCFVCHLHIKLQCELRFLDELELLRGTKRNIPSPRQIRQPLGNEWQCTVLLFMLSPSLHCVLLNLKIQGALRQYKRLGLDWYSISLKKSFEFVNYFAFVYPLQIKQGSTQLINLINSW